MTPLGSDLGSQPPSSSARPRRKRRLWWVAGALTVILVMSGAVLAYVHRPVDHGPLDPRPVVLPQTLGGLPVGEEQLFGQSEAVMKNVFGPYPNGSATYGSFSKHPIFVYSLVVGRGRFANIGDIEQSRPPFTDFGQVRCTTYVDVKGVTRNIKSIPRCWRTEDRLTVSVVGMGTTVTPEMVAATVEEAWAAQQ